MEIDQDVAYDGMTHAQLLEFLATASASTPLVSGKDTTPIRDLEHLQSLHGALAQVTAALCTHGVFEGRSEVRPTIIRAVETSLALLEGALQVLRAPKAPRRPKLASRIADLHARAIHRETASSRSLRTLVRVVKVFAAQWVPEPGLALEDGDAAMIREANEDLELRVSIASLSWPSVAGLDAVASPDLWRRAITAWRNDHKKWESIKILADAIGIEAPAATSIARIYRRWSTKEKGGKKKSAPPDS